jgi:hypothetical protein
MGEESPRNSILNSKRISSPRDPRSPNQPSISYNPHGLTSKRTDPVSTSGMIEFPLRAMLDCLYVFECYGLRAQSM